MALVHLPAALLAATTLLPAPPSAEVDGYAELAPGDRPPPSFVDVRTVVGLDELTATWGLSWYDVDGTGFPDLWLSHHMHYVSALHRNDGDWRFSPADVALGRAVGLDDHFSGWAANGSLRRERRGQ